MSRVGDIEEGWSPSLEEYKKLIGKAILYRQTQKIVLGLKADIPAFRANVVTYTLSALAHKTARRIDLESIWDKQDLTEALRKTITDWALIIVNAMIESAASRNPTEWFKNKACWDVIKNQDLPISEELNSELTGSGETVVVVPVGRNGRTRNETLSPEDQTNIARCVELNADDWMSMIKWAQESPDVEEWQLDVASTLLGQATRNWNKPPSKRQAASICDLITMWKAS
jgi:hypothetical protein